MKFLIYTVVTFGYDNVSPINKSIQSSNIDFWLITDITPQKRPAGWKVKIIERDITEDCFTYNRRLKFGFNPDFINYKAVIYIDGSIRIKKKLNVVMNWCETKNFNFSASKHYLEHTINDEIKHINKLNKAKGDESTFLKDFEYVKDINKSILFENGVFIRKIHTNNILLHQKFSNAVTEVLFKYRSRDQIILPVIFKKLNLKMTVFPYGFRESSSPFALKLHVNESQNLNILQKIKFWIRKKF